MGKYRQNTVIYFVQKGDTNTMLDTAAIIISQGKKIAYAYAEGVNDNMIQSHIPMVRKICLLKELSSILHRI